MDGVESSNEGVLILAATNAPWHVDPAFRVGPLRSHPVRAAAGRGRPRRHPCILTAASRCRTSITITWPRRPTLLRADLKAVVDQAIEAKLREAMKEGIPKPMVTKI